MKILVACENGQISQSIGTCKEFLLIETENKTITNTKTINAPGNGITSLFSFFTANPCDILVCGTISKRAKNTLLMLGFILFPGCTGEPQEIAQKILNGEKVGDESILDDSEPTYAEDDPMNCMADCSTCTMKCQKIPFKVKPQQ